MVDIFYILHSRVEYYIVSVNNFEISYEDLDHDINCLYHFKITKSNFAIKIRIYQWKSYLRKVTNDSSK